MTPERLAQLEVHTDYGGCDDAIELAAEIRCAWARIAALEAALRDVLDEIGPCSDEKKSREFSRYDIDTARAHLEHTIAEARKVLEARGDE